MIDLYIPILISSLSIMLASLAGAVFAWKTLGDWMTVRLRYLIALAAGVFTVIIFNLSQEVLHFKITPLVGGAFLLGIVLLEVFTRLLPKHSHHHGPCGEHAHSKIDARRMMIVDGFHNIHDGLALVPAFLVSPIVGFGTASGILLHELVQEISEFFILKEAGYSTKKALLWNFAVSSTLLIGVVLALTLASVEILTFPLIAFAMGGFLYVLFRDLLPSIISHAHSEKKYIQYGVAFLVGFLLMISVTILLPEEDHFDDDMQLPEGFGLALQATLEKQA
jgi:zinc and cadmium transporter